MPRQSRIARVAIRCCTLSLTFLGVKPLGAGAPGAAGDLYVTCFQNNRVVQLDGQTLELVGEFVSFESGTLDDPTGLAFGPNGNLFVCNTGYSFTHDPTITAIITEHDGVTGEFVQAFITGYADVSDSTNGWLYDPWDLLFRADGRLLVADRAASLLHAYDANTGQRLGVFAVGGDSQGGLRAPTGMGVAPNGNVLVVGSSDPPGAGSGEVIEYHAVTGRLIRVLAAGLPAPQAVAVRSDGNVFVSDFLTDSVYYFDGQSGNALGTFASAGLNNPQGLTFGPNGNLYVLGTANSHGTVFVYDGTTGALLQQVTPPGAALGSSPLDLVFKPAPAAPAPQPEITGISATSASTCAALNGVILTGSNLSAPGTLVSLAVAGQPTIFGTIVSATPTELTVNFNLGPGLAGGDRDLIVSVPGGQSATLSAAIHLTPCYVAEERNLYVLGARGSFYGVFEFDGQTGNLLQMAIGGQGPFDEILFRARTLTFAPDGTLLIGEGPGGFDPGERLIKYDGVTGQFASVFVQSGTGGMYAPNDLAFGSNGNLFVLDEQGVYEFNGVSGDLVQQLVPPLECGLNYPRSFALGPDGNIYIGSDGHTFDVWLFDGQSGACIGPQPFLPAPAPPPWLASPTFRPGGGNLYVVWANGMPPYAAIAEYDPFTGELLDVPIPAGVGSLHGSPLAQFGPNGHLFALDTASTFKEFDLASTPGQYIGIFCDLEPDSSGSVYDATFRPMQGDGDHDWDRDLRDVAGLQRCFGGSGAPTAITCLAFDADFDMDVDLDDAAALATRLSGPN